MARTTHMLLAGLQIVQPPQGRIQYFFRRGCTRLLSTSTPINHIVFFFFLQSTSCIRKPQVRGGVPTPCTLPLDPPLPLY